MIWLSPHGMDAWRWVFDVGLTFAIALVAVGALAACAAEHRHRRRS